MSTSETTNRTHEPSLRELTSQLDGLGRLMEARFVAIENIINERHERYKERSEAAEKAVESAFVASKDAIAKAEEAQKAYNVTHNDLSRKMDQQYQSMMPRTEAEKGLAATEDKIEDLKKEVTKNRDEFQREFQNARGELMREIAGLRESRSVGSGKEEAQASNLQQKSWLVPMLVSFVIGIFGLMIAGIETIVIALKK